LDWHHQTYRCRPYRIRDEEAPDEMWPTEIYPDHDYHVWLVEDLRYGTFGHPWEASLCVFGEELLAAVTEIGDEPLGRILRQAASPTRAADAGHSRPAPE
jgi:Protein of unknown function (DUF2716)